MPHFRREPHRERCGESSELLLDPGAVPDALGVGVSDAGVLVDLTEEVLAVDELERSSPQVLEVKAAAGELVDLSLGHKADEIAHRRSRRDR